MRSEGRLDEVERLVRVGEALEGSTEPGAALDAASQELCALVGGRAARLEVRLAGRMRAYGEPTWRGGEERFPFGTGETACGALVVGAAEAGLEDPLAAGERQALRVAAALVGLFVEKVELARQVGAGGVADGLTGCLTRHEGMERIGAELDRARARRCSASLIFVDVDHLKRLNDRYGHRFGDTALAAVGAALRAGLRGGDVHCRYGGDEFVVLLPDTPCGGAVRVADRLRGELASRALEGPAGPVFVAASFGVSTTLPAEHDAGTLVARADAAMYRAKRAGGNAVRVWQHERPLPGAAGAAGPAVETQEFAP